MRLDVSKALAAEGNEIPFALEIRLSDIFMFGEAIHFDFPAKLSGTYTSVGETIGICGKLFFVANAVCSLCLKPIKKPFSVSIDAKFALSPDKENPDVYVYDGAWIDPADMVADAASLALPIQWRCVESCKGLCPICGADQNQTVCSCQIDGMNSNPFAALKRNDDQNEV